MSDWKLEQAKAQFARIRSLPEQKVFKNPLLVLLIFWAGVFGAENITMIAAVFIGIVSGVLGLQERWDTTAKLILQLFLTNITTLLFLLLGKFAERRPLRTMGLTKQHFLRHYLCGALLGTALFAAVVLIAFLTGAVSFTGVPGFSSLPAALLLIIGWMMQGFSEEVTFRGWLMTTLGTNRKPWTAVIISALCFAAAHLGNDGVSVMAFLNLTLYGIAMSLLMIRTDSIWMCAALHSAWNWAQGNLFGLPVSGIPAGNTLLWFSLDNAPAWLTGGAFGLEAGIGTTAVLTVFIAVLLFWKSRAGCAQEE